MLQVKLDTGFNIEVDFMLPSFFRRFAAWVVDLAIIIAYYIILGRLLGDLSSTKEGRILEWAVFSIPPLFYHLVCEIFLNGQSIGKKTDRETLIGMIVQGSGTVRA